MKLHSRNIPQTKTEADNASLVDVKMNLHLNIIEIDAYNIQSVDSQIT